MLNRAALINKYFSEQSFIDSDIESFDNFMEKELQVIIEENKLIEPTIIPSNVEEYKIRLDKIWIEKPKITEADGSTNKIFPMEARLRNMTYAAPCFIEISSHINGVQRENFPTQIASIPVMLKSKFCNLYKLSKDELVEKGEDPNDPGGYFVINGTEKVIIKVEDLAANKLMVERDNLGVSEFIGKMFSEYGSYKIPHKLEHLKDGLFYLTFTRVKRVPLIIIMKALGLTKDEDIMKFVSQEKQYDQVLINLYEFVDIKTEEDAADYIAKKIGITQSKEIRLERMYEIIDKFFLPHLGIKREDRIYKAYNLCKMLKKFIQVSTGELPLDDKDNYSNKRLKLSGDSLADLFRVDLKVLISDLLYNFHRHVKRGKFPPLRSLIRNKLLTQRLYSSMATGSWIGSRKGISQRIQRINFLDTMSHLQRVVSPLSASQENFEARELHSTHLGRLCPIETPEGTNIGLRKNLALMASVTKNEDENELLKQLKSFGLKSVR